MTMPKPKNFIATVLRLFPSLIFVPWNILTRKGFSFVHPISKLSGKIKLGFATEIGFGTSLKAGALGIETGEYTQINENCVIAGNITIGKRVLIAPSVTLVTGSHKFGLGIQPRFSGDGVEKIMTIGNDVWIGAGVLIIGEVSIGNNCVIAAGVVIDKSVPENTIVKRELSVINGRISELF